MNYNNINQICRQHFKSEFEDIFGKTDDVILPDKNIEQSLNAKGSASYKAVVDGEIIDGTVVVINKKKHGTIILIYCL